MNFKKRINGSWVDTPNYIHNTSTDTLTTLPAVIYPNDTTATVGLKGQTTQSSIPSPTSPVMPQGTGERTGNLCPDTGWRSGQYRDGVWETTNTRSTSDFFPVSSNQYRLKINAGQLISFINFNYFDNQKQWLGNRTTLGMPTFSPTAQNIVIPQLPSNAAYMSITIRFYNDNGNPPIPQSFIDDSNIMVSEGTREPSYEPYGIKIPILSGEATTPVYLGEVESTRRVKKLVLSSSQNWQLQSINSHGIANFYITVINDFLNNSSVISNYFERQTSTIADTTTEGMLIVLATNASVYIRINSQTASTSQEFKNWLDGLSEEATIWYVLAEPTTGIVNEPLRKIGTYADEVSGITIPTIAGANSFDVLTTLKPSEVTVNYKGWHPVQSVHERDNGAWP